ncbi:transposase [Haladaptatus halobius]|uniref:transposase n=1 Tax=Haladaptatus halobius TaxID=2884875 RepID=UPI001D0B58E5|nr:transposase [Haladaptatus halobius]
MTECVEYKAEVVGNSVKQVNPAYTSQRFLSVVHPREIPINLERTGRVQVLDV